MSEPVTSLGLSILKPDAPIVKHRLPDALMVHLPKASAWMQEEVDAGFYIPQMAYGDDGAMFMDLEKRACYMLQSHDAIEVSIHVDSLIRAYVDEHMHSRKDDYLVCAQSLFLHNVIGGGVPKHTDDDDTSGSGSPQRALVAMTYINDGYEGGEIEFPERGFRLAPQPGDVLIFPTNYPHLVYPLTKGVRHSWQRTYYLVDSSGSSLPRT